MTKDMKNLIAHDEYDAENGRTIVFCSQEAMKILAASQIVHMDGTFKSCPDLFSQVYIISGYYRGESMPLAYVLMQRKTRAAYERVFRSLKMLALSVCPTGLTPAMIVTDFETGIIPAIAIEFPNSYHHGCYFHYTQALLRWYSENGRINDLRTNSQYLDNFKLKCAMALLPVEHIPTANEIINQNCSNIQEFNDYVTNFWIPKAHMLSCYGCIETRTNNTSEGYNSYFHTLIGSSQRNIWAFFFKIKEEEAYALLRKSQLDDGATPRAKKAEYTRLNNNLLQWKSSYNNQQNHDILFELRRIARIFRRE